MLLLTKAILKRIPKLYAQDGKGDNAVVYVKLFSIRSDHRFYLTEYDPETKIAFGLTTNAGYEPELGYINLEELESLRFGPNVPTIERDRSFTECTIGDIRSGKTY